MSGLMMVLGGMVAGPGLLAAWEVFGKNSEPDADAPPEPVDEPEIEVIPDEVVERIMKTAEEVSISNKRRSRLEPAVAPPELQAWHQDNPDWVEDDEEEKTVLFKLSDVLDPESTESVLLDE